MPVEVMWFLIVGCFTLFGMIAFIVFTVTRANTRANQLRTEFHTRMLDKFSSAPEFVAFVRSEEGRRLLEGAAMERPGDTAKLLTSIRRGILLVALGVAFLLTIPLFDAEADAAGLAGLILLALGSGYLVSAVVSRRLIHAWQAELNGNIETRSGERV